MDMVIIKTNTNIELNNTVEETCNNLDVLVIAVVSVMQEIFGVEFSGEVASINNKTVQYACNSSQKDSNSNKTGNYYYYNVSNITSNANNGTSSRNRRRLLYATIGAKVIVRTTSTAGVPNNNREGNTNSGDQKVGEKINNNGALQANSVQTTTKKEPAKSESKDNKIEDIGLIIGIVVSVVFPIFCILSCCFCQDKWTPVLKKMNLKSEYPSQPMMTISGGGGYALLMPRIHTPPEKEP